MSLFAVNFHAFNFKLEEVWGHFWIALEMSYSKMPSNFSWLKIKGMKIDRKKRQQNKCLDNYGTVLTYFSIILLFFRNININIDINIPFFSISISKSRFWTWRFQDQDQYRYFGKPEFNIKIKINMTNILKNIGKSIYCPIPGSMVRQLLCTFPIVLKPGLRCCSRWRHLLSFPDCGR